MQDKDDPPGSSFFMVPYPRENAKIILDKKTQIQYTFQVIENDYHIHSRDHP